MKNSQRHPIVATLLAAALLSAAGPAPAFALRQEHAPAREIAAGLEEGIAFYGTMVAAAAAHPEVVNIAAELAAAGHAPAAMLAVPTQREVVIYATSAAMQNPQVAALQQEATATFGFERITIRAWDTGKVLPQNAVLLVANDNTWILRRGDIVRVPVASATSLNALFSAILQAKLGPGHEVVGLIIRRSDDLKTTYIFA